MFVPTKLRLCLFVLLMLPASVRGEWGTVKGRFVLDGEAPQPTPINVTKDQEFCGKCDLVQEEVVISSDSKGIRDIILYLDRSAKPKVHPDYAQTANAEVKLANQCCRFEPRVVLLRTNQTLKVENPDTVAHNTKIDTSNEPINPIIPAGGNVTKKYARPENRPCTVSCSIHPWMKAWLVIKDNPYFAATNANGEFEIKDMPAGDWEFIAWHEKKGFVVDVNVGGKAASWKKGKFTVKIKPNEVTDMGDILVTAKGIGLE